MIDSSSFKGLLHEPRTKRLGLAVALLFVLVGIVGFFVLPPFVKSALLEQAGAALHRQVSVAGVSINPYALSVRIDGLVIEDGEGSEPLFAFDSLYVNVSVSSLFRGAPVIEELRLERPVLRLRRLAAQQYNISDLLDEFLSGPSSPTPAFSLNNIQLTGGRIEFDDRVTDEKHSVSDIELTLPFISSLPQVVDSFVDPAFSAKLDGSPLALGGRSKPFAQSRESELVLDIKGFDLTRYLDYVPVALPVKLQSAVLDSQIKLTFHQSADAGAALTVSGNAALADLRIEATNGEPLFAAQRVEAVVGDFDLAQRQLRIDRVALTQPQVYARARADGTLNWLAVLDAVAATGKTAVAAPPKEGASPVAPPAKAAASVSVPAAAAPALAWSLGEASVHDGSVHWLDETRGRPLKVELLGLDARLAGLASKAGQPASFALSGRIDGEERLSVGSFALKDGELDLAGKRIALGEISIDKLSALVRRAADGSLDTILPPLLRASPAPRGVAAPAASVPAGAKTAVAEHHVPAPAAGKGAAAAPWIVVARKVQGDEISLRLEDRAVQPAATQTISDFGFTIEHLTTEPGKSAQVKAHLRLNQKGEVEVAGDLGLAPLAARLQVDVKGLELLPLQPYFTDKLNIAVTRGQLTTKGVLDVRQPAAGPLAGGFKGQLTVGDFFAVDKINSADFLRWKSFYVGDIDFRLGPDSLSVGEVALTDFFARVIVSKEGKLNLAQIVRRDEPAAAAPATKDGSTATTTAAAPASAAPPAAPAVSRGDGKASVALATPASEAMPIRIGKVTLQGGSVNFTDNFVKPNYSANLRQIGGRISGLSSAPDTVATLDLRGSYDRIAPLSIKARLNPLAKETFLDLDAEIKGIEMTSFSPYSGKYAGYSIAKGKLSLFVKYRIEKRLLTAENRIFLDQLTFGDPVDSPLATKLPVTLAVSLLKNRNGEIDINLPISGSLDDPEFSIGGLVIKVILNLFVKAVTSPFALLGSLFGGGEELSNVDFAYGLSALDSTAQQRLDKLALALNDRPALKLEIAGSVAVERDREGLKVARLERAMRRLKRDDLVKKGVASGSSEEIVVSAAERPALLERVYRDEKFPKPRNLVGLVKSLPPEEMEKLILTNTVIDDEDLRDLGERRAARVRDWLVEKSGAPADRIFLLPPKLIREEGASDAAAAAKAGRVDFSLR
ncbi:DUF748 domain-containing protein [Rhodocyclus tenuis]|uniref:DUF748 domain-containing protein n=1 Tax=Rhodocyclus tenuis TaxID=1066 RepID=A0A840GA07_RHOTE|nr:DUF748 domain-containing protein [Rhodocyclus tenuis]MBB4249163.1 hypothetical protein [Rhodocyclus tenuis]